MAQNQQQIKNTLEQTKVRVELKVEEPVNPLLPMQWAFNSQLPISATAQANNEKIKALDMRRLELRAQSKGGLYN